MIRLIFILVALGLALMGGAQVPETQHQVFLFGDGGEPDAARHNLQLLKNHLNAAGEEATIIFLGDNIYMNGLPDKDHKHRDTQEMKLLKQLEVTRDFKGKTIVIPGNHDWHNSGQEGWDRIRNQSKWVRKYFDSKKVFFPKNGEPGPVEIKLAKGLYLIVLDIQWMLHEWDKPLIHDVAFPTQPADVLKDFYELLEAHRNDHVIVAAHHPMYSYGTHGGKYSLKEHLFPLTEVNPSLYIPLPILGSIYPLYRSTAGSQQDLAHPKYKAIRNAIVKVLTGYPNTIFVSGHEHSLQHIKKDANHFIVSGSGSKTSYLKKDGKHLQFGASRLGFGTVKYEPTGKTHLEFWSADGQYPNGEKIYSSDLYNHTFQEEKEGYPRYSFDDTVKVAHASSQYGAGGLKKILMGVNYRDVWQVKIEAPVFDILKEKGGLKIIKKGGGLQTNSLRLEAKDGKQYVLRSIEKYPEKAVPEILKGTLAVRLVQDHMSASNPYSALVIPSLADALGIYHTNPRVVYIPDDGALANHRETFANSLALFEERPSKDWSDAGHFGYSEDLVNSQEVLENIQEDNDNRVDQRFALRSRMFDMIIADWDRHEDQWRWATYETEGGRSYRPIPRDRDQAFYVNEGLLPKLASRRWALPSVEGFNDDIRWAPGFNFNARHFDRWFLNETTLDDWQQEAQDIQAKLSDDVIEKAIKQWPDPIYDLVGQRTLQTLKARRDNLSKYTSAYYKSLFREVEIVGSEKKELFLIENINADSLLIIVHKISKGGEVRQVIYQRGFHYSETKKIRIYGLDDDDEFKISGIDKSRIDVRIIGGKGKDTFFDLSSGAGAKNVKIYDKTSSTRIATDRQTFKTYLSDKKEINRHQQYWFQYNKLAPLVYGEINPDDGIFVGGGARYTHHGWRKDPYQSRHTLLANAALETDAFNIKYKGDFNDVIGSWNVVVDMHFKGPEVNNFFGLGNESIYDLDRGIDYYRIRVEEQLFRLSLEKNLGQSGLLSLGVQQRIVEVYDRPNSYLGASDFTAFDTSELFNDNRHYGGLIARLQFDTRDEKYFPTRGLYWENELSTHKGWSHHASDYGHLHTSLGLYYSFQYPAWLTLASRTGYAHNFGNFVPNEFYNANTLGHKKNLRGFRKTRFYGQTSFYQNIDLRLKLFDFSSILFPGKFGIHGFYDIGRVWTAEYSDVWHKTLGTGIWVAPLSKFAAAFSYAFSPEEDLITFDFGFFF